MDSTGTGSSQPGATVEVVTYDLAWPERFSAARALLATAVPGAQSIEHIGSTSVPGLAAKPTIDVLMVVDDLAHALDRVGALTAVGFDHRPGAFTAGPEHLFFRRVEHGHRTHHLHVVPTGSPEADGYRLFRTFLIAQPEAAHRYEVHKRALAARFSDRRMDYVLAKEEIVEQLLDEARRWRADT